MAAAILFDDDLIRQYDKAGPRYTSYPTALQFREDFTEADYRAETAAGNAIGKPLSLYFHIPFCDTVCYYCACNRVVTKNHARALPYLEHLYREIELQSTLFERSRPVRQLHWGGGTPTFIGADAMRGLMAVTGEHFQLLQDDSGEYAIEIDPRATDPAMLALLREIGFNRLSIGVQDLDPEVQQAVNRVQSKALIQTTIDAARAQGFKSISVDLIYGLPHQTAARFAVTLEQIAALSPDRISIFNYAHLPDLFKTQRQLDAGALPSAAEKLLLLKTTIERLTAAGYVYIGMDHFAKPDNELTQAQRSGELHRNFQGYSTYAGCDLIAFGATAIGMVGDSYSQNAKELQDYYARIDGARLPIFRGVRLDADDRLRRAVIMQLICHFKLDFAAIETRFNIAFKNYFAAELERLEPMAADGLLSVDTDGIQVSPAGRLLIRNICMTFDRYLHQQAPQRFSKVI